MYCCKLQGSDKGRGNEFLGRWLVHSKPRIAALDVQQAEVLTALPVMLERYI